MFIRHIIGAIGVCVAYLTATSRAEPGSVRIATHSGLQPKDDTKLGCEGTAISWQDYWSPLFDDRMLRQHRDAVASALTEKPNRIDIDFGLWFDPISLHAALAQLKIEGHWNACAASTMEVK